jgi:hypothetical protein
MWFRPRGILNFTLRAYDCRAEDSILDFSLHHDFENRCAHRLRPILPLPYTRGNSLPSAIRPYLFKTAYRTNTKILMAVLFPELLHSNPFSYEEEELRFFKVLR